MTHLIVTLTGPSCAGKTTLMNELLKNRRYKYLRSFTSRDPRPGEKQGVDYNFVSSEEAKSIIESGQSLQHVYFQGRDYYGTLAADANEIFAAGQIPVVVVEPTGVTQFKAAQGLFGYETLSFYLHATRATVARRFGQRIVDDTLDGRPAKKTIERMVQAIDYEAPNWATAAAYDHKFPDGLFRGSIPRMAEYVDEIVCCARAELAE